MSSQSIRITTYASPQAGAVSRIKLINQAVTGPPGADGAGVSVATKEGGTTNVAVTTVLDFDATNFDVTGSSGTATVVIASGQYATAAQGTAADAALPKIAGGASVENIGAVEWNVNTVASSGSTETLDTSTYGTHDVTMSENCTFTFSNPAPSGKETEFKLILRGAFTPTFPASVDWPSAAAPTYTTPSVYVFFTVDAGTTWLGGQVGKAFG
jgi:hypothetical protein